MNAKQLIVLMLKGLKQQWELEHVKVRAEFHKRGLKPSPEELKAADELLLNLGRLQSFITYIERN